MFLITHRLSQIRRADLIVVMRKGRVAAMGTHEHLMGSSKAYRKIFAPYEENRGDVVGGAAHRRTGVDTG
jgi:ATP-binding cassette subfamily B protein